MWLISSTDFIILLKRGDKVLCIGEIRSDAVSWSTILSDLSRNTWKQNRIGEARAKDFPKLTKYC